jgi:cytochrome c-type biogenesis protein CcmH
MTSFPWSGSSVADARRPLWRRLAAPLLLACGLALAMGGASAKEAVPESDDPVLEARMLTIAEELRCLVCQNETIAASHADLAVDLRKQIRIKLKAGQSKQEIVDFMVARYGDFVLYRPPLKASTLLLWLGPFALLIVGAVVMAINIRRRRRDVLAQAWSPEQAQRAQALLDEGGGRP